MVDTSRAALRLAGCFMVLGALMGLAPTSATAQVEDAHEAAEAWLAILDAGDYEASWEAASTTFKAAVTADAWATQITAGHAQVGDVSSRELADSQTLTDPPGAPAGEYVQLVFDSEASTAGPVREMVVVVHDGERGWRVTGYIIQPRG